jgi:hypothetical protein
MEDCSLERKILHNQRQRLKSRTGLYTVSFISIGSSLQFRFVMSRCWDFYQCFLHGRPLGGDKSVTTGCQIRPAVDLSNGEARFPKRCSSMLPNLSCYAWDIVNTASILSRDDTHHQPCPSSSTPQGKPISLRQRLKLVQCTLSRHQIENPPRNMIKPKTTNIHISFKIALSLTFIRAWFSLPISSRDSSFRSCRCLSSERRRDGRRVYSMVYIVRKTTTVVSSAYTI